MYTELLKEIEVKGEAIREDVEGHLYRIRKNKAGKLEYAEVGKDNFTSLSMYGLQDQFLIGGSDTPLFARTG